MNLLEQYIEKIHSEEPYNAEWTKEFPDKNFIKVDVTTNCHGSVARVKRIFEDNEWEKYKELGYWMG